MPLPAWHEEPIAKRHDRAAFDCGEPALNEFLQRHARQNHERGAAKTFLAIADQNGKTVLGFYSLSPASIKLTRTPEPVRRGLAHHDVPVFRLARLAVRQGPWRRDSVVSSCFWPAAAAFWPPPKSAAWRCLSMPKTNGLQPGTPPTARSRSLISRSPCCCPWSQLRWRSQSWESSKQQRQWWSLSRQ